MILFTGRGAYTGGGIVSGGGVCTQCTSLLLFKLIIRAQKIIETLESLSFTYTANVKFKMIKGNLSKDIFERRTSTGSEAFFLFICLDAIKFSLLTFFSLLKAIYPRVLTKPLPNDAKSPLPVDVPLLKTLLLKLPNFLK